MRMMVKLLAWAVAVAWINSPLYAQERTAIKKVVLSDTRTKLTYHMYVNPDCSPSGFATYRISREPKNGKAEMVRGEEFPSFKSDNVRSKCNEQRVGATQLWFLPNEGFRGKDSFEFELIGPRGQYRRTFVEIEVK